MNQNQTFLGVEGLQTQKKNPCEGVWMFSVDIFCDFYTNNASHITCIYTMTELVSIMSDCSLLSYVPGYSAQSKRKRKREKSKSGE